MSSSFSSENRKTIMLTLTESCNLNCSYCYEHNKSNRKMSFEIAKKILDYEFGLDDGFPEIEIDLFGGEPFLEFELIKQIHRYVYSIKSDKRRICFTTTNGTLIHGEIKEWLRKYKDTFCVGLSLDGTKRMHDINRSNSFADIEVEFFKECWPYQDVKMTVSRESLPFLAEGILYIQELGYLCSGSFAFGVTWNLEEDIPILEQQLKILSDYYIANPLIPIAEIIDVKIENLTAPKDTNYRWCGAGKQMKAYDVNGNMFPCQSFMELSIGELSKLSQHVLDGDIDLTDPKCEKCPISQLCSTCYGMNYAQTGKVNIRDKEHCEFNKLIAQANAYIKYHRLIQKETLTDEELLILKGIEILNETI